MLAKFDSNFKRTRSSLQAGCVASTNCKRRDQGMVQCVVAMVYRQGQPISVSWLQIDHGDLWF